MPRAPALGRAVAVAVLAAGAPGWTAPLQEHPAAKTEVVPQAGSTLERTLQVDTDAAHRDVDVVLQLGEEGSAASPPRPSEAGDADRGPGLRAIVNGLAVDEAPPPAAAREAIRVPFPGLVRDVLQWLREHRQVLLAGALGLVALAGVGVLRGRLRATSAERQMRQRAERVERAERMARLQRDESPASSRRRRRSSRH